MKLIKTRPISLNFIGIIPFRQITYVHMEDRFWVSKSLYNSRQLICKKTDKNQDYPQVSWHILLWYYFYTVRLKKPIVAWPPPAPGNRIQGLFVRSHLKKVFSSDIGVVPSSQALTYLSMRVEDPVNRRGGLIIGHAFLSRRSLPGDLGRKSWFSDGFHCYQRQNQKSILGAKN